MLKNNRKEKMKYVITKPNTGKKTAMFAFEATANTKEAAEESIRGFLDLCIYTAYTDRLGDLMSQREDNADTHSSSV